MSPGGTRPMLLRIDEVAERLAISRATTYRLIRGGSIPIVHIGTAVRVPADALHRWLDDQVASTTSADARR